jgi:hypothetical protein
MSKITAQDIENLTKAAQTANLLASDLRAVVSSESALVGDVALDLLEVVSQVEKRLARLIAAVDIETSQGGG